MPARQRASHRRSAKARKSCTKRTSIALHRQPYQRRTVLFLGNVRRNADAVDALRRSATGAGVGTPATAASCTQRAATRTLSHRSFTAASTFAFLRDEITMWPPSYPRRSAICPRRPIAVKHVITTGRVWNTTTRHC
jgi:hypothetical protein